MRKSRMRHLDIQIAGGGFMDCIGIVDTQAVFCISLLLFFLSLSRFL